MTSQFRLHPVLRNAGKVSGIALLAVVTACTTGSSKKPQVEIRGSDPAVPQTTPQPQPQQQQAQAPTTPDAKGIVSYDGYQTAVARDGDTVADVAGRVGMSASELGSYNGLQPSHVLRPGDELVLPQRPGGYTASTVAQAPTPSNDPAISPIPAPTTSIEAQPLDGIGTPADGSLATPEAPEVPATDVPAEVAVATDRKSVV